MKKISSHFFLVFELSQFFKIFEFFPPKMLLKNLESFSNRKILEAYFMPPVDLLGLVRLL